MRNQNIRFDNLKMLKVVIEMLKVVIEEMRDELGLSDKQIIDIAKTILKGDKKQ